MAIAGQDAQQFVPDRRARSWHDAGCLAGQPDGAKPADRADELLSLVRGDVVQDRCVIDDQSRGRRRPRRQRRQVGEQVTAVNGRRVKAGGGDRGLGAGPVLGRIGGKAWREENCEFGMVLFGSLRVRTDE